MQNMSIRQDKTQSVMHVATAIMISPHDHLILITFAMQPVEIWTLDISISTPQEHVSTTLPWPLTIATNFVTDDVMHIQ